MFVLACSCCKFWMWWTIYGRALYRLLKLRISDGRGSKCEATIMKRLAWLVDQLVVSSHEFSFTLFWKAILLSFHRCFHRFLCLFLFSSSLLQASSSFLFVFQTTPLLFFFAVFIALLTYYILDFLLFSFSFFVILLTKKNC